MRIYVSQIIVVLRIFCGFFFQKYRVKKQSQAFFVTEVKKNKTKFICVQANKSRYKSLISYLQNTKFLISFDSLKSKYKDRVDKISRKKKTLDYLTNLLEKKTRFRIIQQNTQINRQQLAGTFCIHIYTYQINVKMLSIAVSFPSSFQTFLFYHECVCAFNLIANESDKIHSLKILKFFLRTHLFSPV